MAIKSPLYFKDLKGNLSSLELSEAWMPSNRVRLSLFVIATHSKGKGKEATNISMPAPVIEMIPQPQLKP